jgi:hypothetical protein
MGTAGREGEKIAANTSLCGGLPPVLNDHHKTHLFKDFLKESKEL